MMYAPAYYHHPLAPHEYPSHYPTTPLNPPPHGTNADPVLINQPIRFASAGPFSGKTMRYELKELQKADLGRKYARVDRRPLDPPPVVLLRIYSILPDTGTEEEISYEDIQTHGLLCTVDLFPVPAKAPKSSQSNTSTNTRIPTTTQTGDGFVHFNPAGPSSLPALTPSPPYRPQSYGPSDIVHYFNGSFALLESSKTTHCLVGATFVQPVLVEISGRKCIVFVFSDLAVKTEGTFTLRYRVFDLFSQSQDPLATSPPPPTVSSASPPSSSISPTLSNATSTSSPGQLPPRQPIMNPYPDPQHGYGPPPTLTLVSRSSDQLDEELQDHQAQFAPNNLHPRIEPHDQSSTLSIFAECWASGSFRVYSTKEFPGLPASTELTKHLARWGVRLNIRETERRRRRRSMMDDEEDYEFDASDLLEGTEGTREQQPLPHRKVGSGKSRAQQSSHSQSPAGKRQKSPQKGRQKQKTVKPRRYEEEEGGGGGEEGEDEGLQYEHEGYENIPRGQEDPSRHLASGSGLPGYSTPEYFGVSNSGTGIGDRGRVQEHGQVSYVMPPPPPRPHGGIRLPMVNMYSPHPPGGITGITESRGRSLGSPGRKRQSGDSSVIGATVKAIASKEEQDVGVGDTQGGSGSVGVEGPYIFGYSMDLSGSQG